MKPIQELLQYITDHVNTNFMNELREAVREEVAEAVAEAMGECGYTQTCMNCKHFDEPKEHCMFFKPASRPPARVIAFGCDAFLDASEAISEGLRTLIPPEPAKPTMHSLPPSARLKPAEIRKRFGFDDWDDDIPF